MTPKNPLIVALDVPTISDAKKLMAMLNGKVGAFKVGLQLMNEVGAPALFDLAQDTPLFFDGKFFDIPNTVAGACRAVAAHNVWMLNVHALGGMEMMQAAKSASSKVLVIGVTILTSLDVKNLNQCGFPISSEEELRMQVVRLAKLAKDAGLDGVVASPHEIKLIRSACGPNFKIVTPGIRPTWATADDQKRFTTPAQAISLGADYIVVGRPITNPPASIGSPVNAVEKILEEISQC